MRNTPPTPRRVRSAHESKSATVRAAAAAPSRRQQSKWHREQHQQRTLYLLIGALVVIVLAIFGGGIFYDNVVRANEVVAQIGPDNVTAAQLLDQVRPSSRSLDSQAKTLGAGADSTQIAQYVDQQKRSLPDQTLNTMIDDRVIQQESARRSIVVAPADLDDKERQTVADFQSSTNPAPTPEATATTEAAPTTEATPADTVAPTPQVAVATSPPTTPTAVPTLVGDTYGPALQQLLDRNFLSEAEFRDRLQQSLLRDKLQTAIGLEQVPGTQDQVHARQILVATQEDAISLMAQLQGGADFGQLAQQLSTDTATKDKGGDLGWFAQGGLGDKPFDDAAFTLQPGQLSDVIQSARGYGVLQVLERDPARPVAADQLLTQRQKAFTDWLGTQRTGPDVKLQISQSQRDWILARIGIRP
jgi:parvulin-like peptidyl-prolyl isomerase